MRQREQHNRGENQAGRNGVAASGSQGAQPGVSRETRLGLERICYLFLLFGVVASLARWHVEDAQGAQRAVAELWRDADLVKLASFVVKYIACVNIATAAMMLLDKQVATFGWHRHRLSESAFEFGAFIGGWPATWWAIEVFRHKSKKLPFQHRVVRGTAASVGLAFLLQPFVILIDGARAARDPAWHAYARRMNLDENKWSPTWTMIPLVGAAMQLALGVTRLLRRWVPLPGMGFAFPGLLLSVFFVL